MAHRFSYSTVETLTGHRTLTQAEVNETSIWSFDPGGGARNLILPAEATNVGTVLFIHNSADAAEIITIQDDAAATVCTPTQAESAIVWCDGVSWFGLAGVSS